jgi:hypothetical protein
MARLDHAVWIFVRILTIHDPYPEITQLYGIPDQDDVPFDALRESERYENERQPPISTSRR